MKKVLYYLPVVAIALFFLSFLLFTLFTEPLRSSVLSFEHTDEGCRKVERAIVPNGDCDYRRALPYDVSAKRFKALADFDSMKVISIPIERLRFDPHKRDIFINIYGVDPEHQLQGRVLFAAVTINGTVIRNCRITRPNPSDLYSIVRSVGKDLVVYRIVRNNDVDWDDLEKDARKLDLIEGNQR